MKTISPLSTTSNIIIPHHNSHFPPSFSLSFISLRHFLSLHYNHHHFSITTFPPSPTIDKTNNCPLILFYNSVKHNYNLHLKSLLELCSFFAKSVNFLSQLQHKKNVNFVFEHQEQEQEDDDFFFIDEIQDVIVNYSSSSHSLQVLKE